MRAIEAGSPPAIVDVRSRREFEGGHVPGAVHVPFWSAFARRDDPRVGDAEQVVVYCEHGPRAGVARLAFRMGGHRRVTYLAGHMSAWRKAGLPMEREDGRRRDDASPPRQR